MHVVVWLATRAAFVAGFVQCTYLQHLQQSTKKPGGAVRARAKVPRMQCLQQLHYPSATTITISLHAAHRCSHGSTPARQCTTTLLLAPNYSTRSPALLLSRQGTCAKPSMKLCSFLLTY